MKNIFVTGTDTGVGKTVITGLWARFLTQKGFNVATQKWVETGSKEGFSHDVDFHLKMMGQRIMRAFQLRMYFLFLHRRILQAALKIEE